MTIPDKMDLNVDNSKNVDNLIDFQSKLESFSNTGSYFGRSYLILDAQNQLQVANFGKYLLQVCMQFVQGKSHAESIKKAAKDFIDQGIQLFGENMDVTIKRNIQDLAERVNINTDLSRNGKTSIIAHSTLTTHNQNITNVSMEEEDNGQVVERSDEKLVETVVESNKQEARNLISQIIQDIPNVSWTIVRSPDNNFQIKFIANNEDARKEIVDRCRGSMQANEFEFKIDEWQTKSESNNLYPFTLSSNQSLQFLNFLSMYQRMMVSLPMAISSVNDEFDKFMSDLKKDLKMAHNQNITNVSMEEEDKKDNGQVVERSDEKLVETVVGNKKLVKTIVESNKQEARNLISQIIQDIPNVSWTIVRSPGNNFQIKFIANNEDARKEIVDRCRGSMQANEFEFKIDEWQTKSESNNLYPFTLSSNQSLQFLNFYRMYERMMFSLPMAISSVNAEFDKFMSELKKDLKMAHNQNITNVSMEEEDNGQVVERSDEKLVETVVESNKQEARNLISQIMQDIPNVSCTIVQSPTENFQIKFIANSEDAIVKIVDRCRTLIQANELEFKIEGWQIERKSDNLYPFTLSSNQSYYFFNFLEMLNQGEKTNQLTVTEVNKKFKEFMSDLQKNLLKDPLKTEALDKGGVVKERPKLNKTNEEILETFKSISTYYGKKGSSSGAGGGAVVKILLSNGKYAMVAMGARSGSRRKADEQKRMLLKNQPDYIREIYGKNDSKINFINDPAESKSTAELRELAIIEDVINYLYREIKEEDVSQINIGSITEEQFAQGLRDVQELQKKWGIDYGELLHH